MSRIKAPGEILDKLRLANFREFDNFFTGMIDEHGINIDSLKEMRNKKPLISVHRNNHIIVQGHRIKHATAKKSLVVTASRL